LKYIQNEKTRKLAFIQRKKKLTKKIPKFFSKFGVEACLIVNVGDDNSRSMTWPQDTTIVRSMLVKYEQQKIEGILLKKKKIEGTTRKEFDVKDCFANKKNMIEAERFLKCANKL